ncbi:Neuronal acetylcholine receptor subunit alpha-7 [Mactra antiquata]
MILLSIVVLVFGHFRMCASSSYQDQLNLYSNLTATINPTVRPVLNQSDSVRVNISVHLLSVIEVNEREQSMTSFVAISNMWIDEALQWNVSEYGDSFKITMLPSDLWIPEFMVSNTIRNDIMILKDNGLKIDVLNNGFATRYSGGAIKTSCPIDVSKYPFDTQVCLIVLSKSSWDNEMDIFAAQNYAMLVSFNENKEWNLARSVVRKETSIPNISELVVTLYLQRRPFFYVINIILPMVMISFMNILCFKIPPRSGERISYSVSLLLTFVVLLSTTAETMPRVSDNISYLHIYINCQFMLGCLITTISAIIVKVDHSDTHVNVPRWCQLILCLSKCLRKSKINAQETKPDSNDIDQDQEMDIPSKSDSKATENLKKNDDIEKDNVTGHVDEMLFYIFVCLFILSTFVCFMLIWLA